MNVFQSPENRVQFELAVEEVNGFYLKYRRHPIKVLYSDNKSAVYQFDDAFKATGGTIVFKGAGEHVGLAERYIGVMRKIVVGLPYTALPRPVKEAIQLFSIRLDSKTNGMRAFVRVRRGLEARLSKEKSHIWSFGLCHSPNYAITQNIRRT